jgi:hypothetical protein
MKRSSSRVSASYYDIEDAHKNNNNEHLADFVVQLQRFLHDDMGTVWTLDAERLGTSTDMAERGIKTHVSEMDEDTYKKMVINAKKAKLEVNLYLGCIVDSMQKYFTRAPITPTISFLYLDFTTCRLGIFRKALKLFNVYRTNISVIATTFSMRLTDSSTFYTDEEIKRRQREKRYWTFAEHCKLVYGWMERLLPGADIQVERIIGYQRDYGTRRRKKKKGQSMGHSVFLIDWPDRVETKYMPLKILKRNVPGAECNPPKKDGVWKLVQWAGFPNDLSWEREDI